MDTGDFVELGVGLALGGMMTRTFGNVFADALDSRTGMQLLAVPQTRTEIQILLDKLDVGLANGNISEPTYQILVAKWTARLNAVDPRAT